MIENHRWELPVLRYHKILLIYPYPFFCGNYPIVLLNNIINDCICIITASTRSYLFIVVYVIQEIVGNENSPYSLNAMVNYHYHSENRVITR